MFKLGNSIKEAQKLFISPALKNKFLPRNTTLCSNVFNVF